MNSPGIDHKGRQKHLQRALASHGLDAQLITHLPNVFYLCGFSGSAGALVLTGTKSVYFTDGRYTSQARSEVKGARIVASRKGPAVAAAEWLAAQNRKMTGRRAASFRLGIEGEHLSVAARTRLAGVLPSHVRLREAPSLVERARMVKDAREVQFIREAVLVGARLFERALQETTQLLLTRQQDRKVIEAGRTSRAVAPARQCLQAQQS